ncbi:MAG: exodeoxyribonuclease beta subunit, partial [Betaproteobacteria bacterium]
MTILLAHAPSNMGTVVPESARRLDVVNAALENLNLIEANAGTGKTWTITALYVRLLLEAERTVDSILVVTFTEAATAELRDRIRNRLADARAAFERESAGDDAVMAALLTRVKDRARALLRLTSALRDFDQAPIYTIHGFCQRVLGDSAFESGMPFRTEILVDQTALLQEIVEDFWRYEIHAATPLFTRFLISKDVAPGKLSEEMSRHVGKPYLEVRAPNDVAGLQDFENAYGRAFAAARKIWLAHREAIAAKLIGNSNLSGNTYRPGSISSWLEDMHACFGGESISLELCDKFEKFTTECLEAGTKKGGRTPSHPFFVACQDLKQARAQLLEAYQRRLPIMKARLLEFCNAELAKRKERKQLQSYDDLLINLDKALTSEHGETLAATVRERYSAALIDEFQDTDPVQYGIFRRIYGGTDLPVFLVGDPKQSIFGFRGADVFEYFKARAEARHAHTLDVNWRSEPSLLAAVNCIFGGAAKPFVIGDIPFNPSEPAAGNRGRFVIEGVSGAPFEIWFVERGQDGKPIARGALKDAACRATAAEIARLLNLGARGHARIVDGKEERRLCGGDIAVLVRTHDQAKSVCEALSAVGVASVQRGSQNVFATRAAEELERVL